MMPGEESADSSFPHLPSAYRVMNFRDSGSHLEMNDTSAQLNDKRRLLVPAVLLMLAAVAARAVAALVWWADTASDPDVYVSLAEGLRAGRGFCTPGTPQPTAYRPPLYPLLLAAFQTVMPLGRGGSIVAFNALCDLVTLMLVLSAAWRLTQRRSAVLCAGLGIALDPLLLRYTALPMTEPCYTMLTTAALLTVLTSLGGSRRSMTEGAVAGLLLGLAALCRPTLWAFLPLLFLGDLATSLWSRVDSGWRQWMTWWIALVIALGLSVAPWSLRNLLVLGTPTFTTTHGGYTLLLGNNSTFYREVADQPWGTVWSGASLTRWQESLRDEMARSLGSDADEVTRDRWQAARARNEMRNDPAGFRAAVVYRFRSLWSPTPRQTGSNALPPIVGWFLTAGYAGLVGLAAIGWIDLIHRRQPAAWLIPAYVLSLQIVHLLYWTDTRMRTPLEPWLMLFAGVGVACCLEKSRRIG